LIIYINLILINFNLMQYDPGSGKKLFRIPDPWGQKGPDPGSETLLITTLTSQYELLERLRGHELGKFKQFFQIPRVKKLRRTYKTPYLEYLGEYEVLCGRALVPLSGAEGGGGD
jgi:hypothetical protein